MSDCNPGGHTERVAKFLADIVEVYKKHNLSLSHEDPWGGFLVEEFKQKNVDWLNEAADCRNEKAGE